MYESVTQEDSDGNLFIELPEGLLRLLGWNIGDTLEWSEGDNKILAFTLTKKDNDDA